MTDATDYELANRRAAIAKLGTAGMIDCVIGVQDAIRSARLEALEEAAKVAELYKNKADMRAAIHKNERNTPARDAALDKFEAALEIETAIRALKDNGHE